MALTSTRGKRHAELGSKVSPTRTWCGPGYREQISFQHVDSR
ncbi:MAG: hypothetical protein QOJ68_3602 [Blastococcus sp.]|jgi:hypothetical protein|nr:hypothetical protein [Blastococcus sp.]